MAITADEFERINQEWLANRARQIAMTNAQRFEKGQFTIDLVRAHDDPSEGEPEFQLELSGFGAGLRSADIRFSQTAIAMDSMTAHGFPLPEFILALESLGTTAITAITVYGVAWVQARRGRKIRITIGEVEVEASSPSEVEHALRQVLEIRDRLISHKEDTNNSHLGNNRRLDINHMTIKDDDIRGVLLNHLYELRHNNGGWVPISEIILSPHMVEIRVIFAVCQQLADLGLIGWMTHAGQHGIAKITGKGVAAVESGESSEISVRFPPRGRYTQRIGEGESEITSEATSDVYAAIEGLVAVGKRANSHNVPEEARKILIRSSGGRLRAAEASDQIRNAIAALVDKGQIEAHPEPRKDWLILKQNSADKAVVTEVSNKVFVVHGRDDAAKNELRLFLIAVGLEPIILHMRPNGGRHLLTKFREESEGADFAVVLMTPDDDGGLAGTNDLRQRARQNVVLELGFFLGKLGPANVAALVKGDVERPSDFDGIVYIPLDSAGAWKTQLARELQHANVPFDAAKLPMA